MKVGIISDTHDLLRQEVINALSDSDVILHAGDICSQTILDRLEAIAPVYVVRGNADKEWAGHLPVFLDFTLGDVRVYMTHKKKDLPDDHAAYDLVVIGHSHKYGVVKQGNTVICNPGSCGQRRFHLPVTIAKAQIEGKQIEIRRLDFAMPIGGQKLDTNNTYEVIETVLKEYAKGHGQKRIAEKYGIDPALAEQIIRLYVTHPGVTVDGIMTKMGL
ncbi:MAG: YfcE family phosphodiesterase [Solobacterium sp.]|nr:YfcE family phosphodiesterase [Solobacterium sp.]